MAEQYKVEYNMLKGLPLGTFNQMYQQAIRL
jgi:hypothetical protein